MNLSKTTLQGAIFDIQRFSVHDGPGIRTTVFMKGCPLRCDWCHNPEGISYEKQVRFFDEACIACEACVDGCEPGGRSVKDGQLLVAWDNCVSCGECVRRCPANAAQWCGTHHTPAAILIEVMKDQVFYGDTGGVTFSGGEPLLQPDFVLACLKLCKERGLHTAIDTSGFVKWEHLASTTEFCDLYLFDVKAVSPDIHKSGTRVDNGLILDNLTKLAEADARIWVRVPVVDGFNNSAKEMKAIADLLAGLDAIEQVTLMPYHTLGKSKYQTFGGSSPMGESGAVTPEDMQSWTELFIQKGLNVI